MELQKLIEDHVAYGRKAWPKATPFSSLEKAKDEIKEVEAAFLHGPAQTTEEYVDVLMCIYDSADRAGISPGTLKEAFEKKLNINKQRRWKENPNGSYSHVKESTI